MPKSNISNSSKRLHCRSCGRTAGTGSNGVDIVMYLGQSWCARCAHIQRTPSGSVFIQQPSPGRMFEGHATNPLDIWDDCYLMKPKHRIRVSQAKREIQRAWRMWRGKKDSSVSMLIFFGWLRRFRPYFLTFRGRGDPWQQVHSWLLEHERTRRPIR